MSLNKPGIKKPQSVSELFHIQPWNICVRRKQKSTSGIEREKGKDRGIWNLLEIANVYSALQGRKGIFATSNQNSIMLLITLQN